MCRRKQLVVFSDAQTCAEYYLSYVFIQSANITPCRCEMQDKLRDRFQKFRQISEFRQIRQIQNSGTECRISLKFYPWNAVATSSTLVNFQRWKLFTNLAGSH